MAISRQNPFPGMNPYLEASWPDVHTQLIGDIRNALGTQLPPGLVARSEEAVAVDSYSPDEESGRRFRADGAVVRKESWRYGEPPVWKTEEHTHGGVVTTEPWVFHVEELVDRWVEIRSPSGKVVTIIEVISPWNRETAYGRRRYLEKQGCCLRSTTSLVEIDLIRVGEPVFELPAEKVAALEGTHYFVSTFRASRPSERELYPCPLQERLPVLAIPLRPTDEDVPLDLQPLIDRCYELGGYWQGDYREDPVPPVLPEEREWLDERLRAVGLR